MNAREIVDINWGSSEASFKAQSHGATWWFPDYFPWPLSWWICPSGHHLESRIITAFFHQREAGSHTWCETLQHKYSWFTQISYYSQRKFSWDSFKTCWQWEHILQMSIKLKDKLFIKLLRKWFGRHFEQGSLTHDVFMAVCVRISW